jgi:diguanylate cyclase (GGDEF)-like protein
LHGLPLTVAIVTVVLLIAAIVLLVFKDANGRRALGREAEQNKRKQQQIVELSKMLKTTEAELARKREIAELIPLITGKMTQKLPQDSFPPFAVRAAKELFHARQAGYFVPIEGSSDFTLAVGVGFPADWQENVRIPSDEGILGTAIQKKVVVAKCDPLSSAGRRSTQSSLERSGIEPDFVAPVLGVSGIAGAIVIAGCPFPLDEERKYVSMLADLFSTALRNAALVDLSKTSTWVDHLTGVANRLYFSQRFESEIRRAQNYRQPLALFMLDIDGFKNINDTYGHPAGDVVIKMFADIIRRNTRSSDLICRFGGDEFLVLMTSSNLEQALAYADNLRGIIDSTNIMVPRLDTPIHLTTSGGLATYPADGQSTTELLRAADDALYEAKRKGRNRIMLAQSLAMDGSIFTEGGSTQEEPGSVGPKKDAGKKEDET